VPALRVDGDAQVGGPGLGSEGFRCLSPVSDLWVRMAGRPPRSVGLVGYAWSMWTQVGTPNGMPQKVRKYPFWI